MDLLPNSTEARDIRVMMPAAADMRQHEETGSLVIERGEGIHVYDNTGKRYIEGLAGLWSVAVGFGEPRLAQAAHDQMTRLPYYHQFALKTSGPAVDLAERLLGMMPFPMSKVHFTSSGSEANDLVAKMVWYRSNAMGQPQRKKIIGRIKGYHGVTIAAASITGIPRNHESFDLPLDRMIHTACPSYDLFAQGGESEADFTARMLAELEQLIEAEGPDTIAAMWGEPVMGAGGVLPPPEGYWAGVQDILRRHGILLVVDEVICGFGRTGRMFGCETYGIVPDVMVLSKQLSSSYLPLSAIVMNDAFYQPIADESHRIGSFGHGFTASGHPVACAVALENLKIIEERDLAGNAARLSPQFLAGLKGLGGHPLATGWRGVGLIGAVELAPWDKVGAAGAAVAARMQDEGLIIRGIGDSICFCPPLIITADQVGEMFAIARRAMDAVAAERA